MILFGNSGTCASAYGFFGVSIAAGGEQSRVQLPAAVVAVRPGGVATVMLVERWIEVRPAPPVRGKVHSLGAA